MFFAERNINSQEQLVCLVILNKFHPRTEDEGPDGKKKHSSILFLTSALDGVVGQRHTPAALPTGKDPVPIV